MSDDWDTFRLEFGPDNRLRILGRKGLREPTCPKCLQPIHWVLDMMSFQRDEYALPESERFGGFVLCHARCTWTPEGFQAQERLAREQVDD